VSLGGLCGKLGSYWRAYGESSVNGCSTRQIFGCIFKGFALGNLKGGDPLGDVVLGLGLEKDGSVFRFDLEAEASLLGKGWSDAA
jgi:hypothetical protein